MSHLHTDQRPRAADVQLKVFGIDLQQSLGQFGASVGRNMQSALVFQSCLRVNVSEKLPEAELAALVLQVSMLMPKEGVFGQISESNIRLLSPFGVVHESVKSEGSAQH